ncbi:MAG TPA: inositol-3-phosphate synthase [Nitrososphaerales archaeon]|nr:inositol-3-phosphate synthase [Nitrososphaerales archaeon]
MPSLRVGIVGVGNCASGIIQGVQMRREGQGVAAELGNRSVGGYKIEDIRFVSAFDVGSNKIGKPLGEAIYEPPNTVNWTPSVSGLDVTVKESPVLDGVGIFVDNKIRPIKSRRSVRELHDSAVDELRRTKTEVLVNYLPVGSQKATEFWAEVALEARVGMVNCMPVFIASDARWAARFKKRGLPIIGDDVKGVVGATIVHRTLARLCAERGVEVTKTYQINVGGNTDFLNMKEQSRLESKRTSKTEAVQTVLADRLPADRIYVGPSDFIPYLGNTKIAFIRIEGRMFPGVPFNMEMRLEVDDKANSAGVVVDAVRYCKVAVDRKIGGPLIEASAWLMKHPPSPMSDDDARVRAEAWVRSPRTKRNKAMNRRSPQ